MTIHILGSGITNFGELWGVSLRELAKQAINEAVQSAGLDSADIEALFIGNKAAGNFEGQHHLNALISGFFTHYPPAMRVEAACASGGMALVAAEHALMAGIYKTVLVVGVEKMTDVESAQSTEILSGAADCETEYGSTFPGLYALLTQAHMNERGTTREQLSAVAVKNHQHALQNPRAQFHKAVTLDEVSKSQLVADPLRLLDCSPLSDGAAAVVLSTKKIKGKPKILGFGQGQDSLSLAGRNTLTSFKATIRAAEKAYEMAGILPANIQLAEVHDCFTIAELLAIEDLGLIAKEQSGVATLAGQTTFGASLVINPSGGLKACGHPVGATGVKQVAYISQLWENGQYQHALAHNVGGSGATAVVHIIG